MVHKMHATSISMYKTYLKERIIWVITIDQHYLQVNESLQHNDVAHKYKDYKLEENGIILF
jgi:hypothetical protein